jgi:hypothetical protein
MSIPISCPTCRKTALASKAAAGKTVACPGCGTVIPVPAIPVAIPVASVPSRPQAIPVSTSEPARPQAIPVSTSEPGRPQAIPVSTGEPVRHPLPPNPSEARTGGEVSVWVWRGLGIGAFVAICVVFAIIGAALNPDEPGLGASRMARKVGAPLALLLIGAIELVLWLRQSQKSSSDQSNRPPRQSQ